MGVSEAEDPVPVQTRRGWKRSRRSTPSRSTAIVFDSGTPVLDGRADFLAEPHPGLRANVALEQVTLD